MKYSRNRCIPVIMYHSVRAQICKSWEYRHLTLDLRFFERQLEYLKRHEYEVVSLEEVVAFKRGDLDLPVRSVCLTFDDGYLDNWVYAFPILAKYGFRSTLFVATDFVDPRKILRPTIADFKQDALSLKDFDSGGFMSWDELRAIESTGLVDIQSHTQTHTFFPTTDKIIGFHHPCDDLPWPDWNANQESKPFYMSMKDRVNNTYGSPIYPVKPALVARKILEHGGLTDHLTRFVAHNGGLAFFEHDSWLDELYKVTAEYVSTEKVWYETETEEAQMTRVRTELEYSKIKIEKKLGKRVRYLCWPNGGWSDEAHSIALDIGYLATTAKGSPNEFASPDPTRIMRTGMHQVGSRRLISSAFVHYTLRAHAEDWPYAQLRRYLARTGVAKMLKRMVYR